MEKVICLLWAADGAERARFTDGLLDRLPHALANAGASAVRLNLEDAACAAGAMLRQSCGPRQHDAAVQFWVPSANHLLRQAINDALDSVCASWHGWVVAESTIIANTAHPPVRGERTCGWAQMAFLTLPARLGHEEWLEIWQDHHTLVAIETQANFEYVQNVVVRALTAGAPPYVAIVEECFEQAALTDPFAFFDAVGDPQRFKANLDRMMASCDRFIDRGTIDVIPTSQFCF